jgi:tetratricopeptide (TPR) repeat protein
MNNVSELRSEDEDFKTRSDRRDAERAKRREERRKKVRRQKIMIAVSGIVIIAAVVVFVLTCLTPVKYMRSMSKGEKGLEEMDYEESQEAYSRALELKDTDPDAYRGLADALTAQSKVSEAEETVYAGWEKTGDESLLRYYCTLVLNEAVEEINDKNCTLDTVDKCLQVLELDAENEDALELMDTCYTRLFPATEDTEESTIFYDSYVTTDTCDYEVYEQLLTRLLAIYAEQPSETLGQILEQYALIDVPKLYLSITHMDAYVTILTQINEVVSDAQITETIACLNRAQEIEDYFAECFNQFEQGNFAYARELIASDEYQKLRDDFIAGDSGYWQGSVYIPVSKEQLVLNREDGKVTFSFLDYDDYDNAQGIITVWGSKQEDDGIQRSVISYEPVSDTGEEFPHTEYTVQYLYSNVKINGEYVPQMNYRFDTKVTTEEGTTTTAIGDWGGEHEFEIDY